MTQTVPIVTAGPIIVFLFQELEYFDYHSLTKQQLQQLSQLVCSPQFDPEYVREASKACESLCHWVMAVYECCCMHQHLVVNQRLQAQAAEARDRLQLARRKKEEAYSSLKNLMLRLQTVREELKKQMFLLQEAERIDKEAGTTVGKLGKYVAIWKKDAQVPVVKLTFHHAVRPGLSQFRCVSII